MDNDFKTPTALAVLFELAKELRRQGNLLIHQGKTDTSSETIKQQWQILVHLAQLLGLEAVPKDETDVSGLVFSSVPHSLLPTPATKGAVNLLLLNF